MAKEEKTLSDNELIAEFMGAKQTGARYEVNGEIRYQYFIEGYGYVYPTEYAFDIKWDWLMPVVIAIEEIEEPHPSNNPEKGTVWPYNVDLISRNKVEIYDHINDKVVAFVDQNGLTKIESAHKAVIEFIKWYNKQK